MPITKQKLNPVKEKYKKILTAVANGSDYAPAIRAAGYGDKSVARQPGKITKTKLWQELLEEYVPDDKLSKVLNEGFGAWKRVTSPTEPDAKDPDYAVRHKYLDTALKLKSKYPQGQLESGDQSFHVHLHGGAPDTLGPIVVDDHVDKST